MLPAGWVGIGLAACGVVLAVALLAISVASPALASVGSEVPRRPIPTLPLASPNSITSLDGVMDPVPFIVSDLPDAPSRQFSDDYHKLRILDGDGAKRLYAEAWQAVESASSGAAPVTALGELLLTDSNPFGGLTEIDGPFNAALPYLKSDPRNSDRLSNLAVVLYILAWSDAQGKPASGPAGDPGDMEGNAVELLADSAASLPVTRAVALNYAFLANAGPLPGGDPAIPVRLLDAWSAANPADWTARLLEVSLKTRRGFDDHDLVAALSDVPNASDAKHAALADAARGDAYLVLAHREHTMRPQTDFSDAWVYAPFHAAELARSAVDEYDRALTISTDPGLYAGRARAILMLLPDDPRTAGLPATPAFLEQRRTVLVAAFEAQRRAVELAPKSSDFKIELAAIEEQMGEWDQMHDDAAHAFALAASDPEPFAEGVRYVPGLDPGGIRASHGKAFDPDRGFLGYSYGSGRPHWTLWLQKAGLGGGASVATLESVLQTTETGFQPELYAGVAVDVAARLALEADLLRADSAAGQRDAHQWRAAMADPHLSGPPFDPNDPLAWQQGRYDHMSAAESAVAFVTASRVPPVLPNDALAFAQNAFRRVGQFVQAAAVCDRAARFDGTFTKAAAVECKGESDYLAGRFQAAEQELSAVYNPHGVVYTGLGSTPSEFRVDVQAAATAAQAHTAGIWVNPSKANPNAGDMYYDEQIGEVLLHENAPKTALVMFQSVSDNASQASALLQVSRVNSAIALLQLSRKTTTSPPDCGSYRSQCDTAKQDILDALLIDPDNPTYHMDLGWIDRLEGDAAGSEAENTRAVAVDPTIFPALNDLGVEAAVGSRDVARQFFEQALQSNGDYDLAAWNLGVLYMQSGVAGIPRGQAFMARAIRINPRLVSISDPEYLTDERFYSVAAGRRSFGAASVSIPLVSSLTLLSLLGLVALDVGRHLGFHRLGDALDERMPRMMKTLRGSIRRYGFAVARLRRRLAGHGRGRYTATSIVLPASWSFLIIALAGTTYLTSTRVVGSRVVATIVSAFAALVLALCVHEGCHFLAARRFEIHVNPAIWTPGFMLAAAMLPFNPIGIPYPGHRVDARRRAAFWVAAAGPASNVAAAGLALILLLVFPAPILLTVIGMQLGVATFSLLPFRPMDGYVLQKHHRIATIVSALALGVIGVILFEGLPNTLI